MELKGYQRKYLRSIAHNLKPSVYVGKNDITEGVFKSINDSFNTNELIKIKLFTSGNKKIKSQIISDKIQCNIVGIIGKILIAYKENKDPELRKIILPNKWKEK